jgi:hypothetical protein
VFALPSTQRVVSLAVPAGTTLRQAVERSRVLDDVAAEVVSTLTYGVFGRALPPDALVRDGDRIEIYRPLALDPKQRRRRAGGVVKVRSGR